MSLGVCASPVMLLTRLTLSPSSPDLPVRHLPEVSPLWVTAALDTYRGYAPETSS
jgi:hypothetical protein